MEKVFTSADIGSNIFISQVNMQGMKILSIKS